MNLHETNDKLNKESSRFKNRVVVTSKCSSFIFGSVSERGLSTVYHNRRHYDESSENWFKTCKLTQKLKSPK